MIKVYLTKGLPGSGKSTWAKELIDKNPNSYKRINKDDLRAMVDNGKYSSDNEKFILKIRDSLILLAIQNGKHVIIDDTNLDLKHELHIKDLIKGKAEIVIQDFTEVPLETCIQRDLKRISSVGEKVIRNMHKQYLQKNIKYVEDINLPHAIIVDIDGTLAKMVNRNPFEWNKVKHDSCNDVIKQMVNDYKGNVIIFTGRDGVCKTDTIEWLHLNDIKYDKLFMRDCGNTEKDSIIKQRMFDNNIRGKYYIDYILDDRNQVVEMWRSIGLICLQVAEGDF